MSSQPLPSCIYQHGTNLKLRLIHSNLTSRKSELPVAAEASNAGEDHSSHRFSGAALEAEIAKRLSTLLSENPDEATLASAQLEVYLSDKVATAHTDFFPQKRDTDIPASAAGIESIVYPQAGGVANMASSPPAPLARGIDPAVAAHLNNTLSTLIAQQPSAAVPEILRLQAALREHEQIPVLTIEVPMEVTSTQAPPTTEMPEPTITAQVQRLFQPFTMSVAMKVHIEGHSEPSFLKLFDRRFSSTLRINDKVPAWGEEREAKYHEFIRTGEAEKFTDWLNYEDESSEEAGGEEKAWTGSHEEAFLQDKCHDLYKTELAAYHALAPLQGICIPKLLATVMLQPFPNAHLETQKHTAVYGLLLSYIPGFTLSQLHRHVPRADWQGIGDAAVQAVHACSGLGILNEDVRPSNCIVRCVAKTSAVLSAREIIYRPFIIDFGMTRLRRRDESDGEWREAKQEVDEEGAMGAVLMRDLEEVYGMGGYVYDRSRIYHRMGDSVLSEALAGSDHAGNEEVDVWDEQTEDCGREDNHLHPQAVLVDEHDDLESSVEDFALEGRIAETDGGFRRAYPLSAAESRAMGIHAPDEGH